MACVHKIKKHSVRQIVDCKHDIVLAHGLLYTLGCEGRNHVWRHLNK